MVPIFDFGQSARGIIAIGQEATGVIAIGQMATGVVAIGQLSRGFFVVGQLAIGLCTVNQVGGAVVWSLGQLTIAGRARGQLPISLIPNWKRPKADVPDAIAMKQLEDGTSSFGWVSGRVRKTESDAIEFVSEGQTVPVQWNNGVDAAAWQAITTGTPDVYVRMKVEQRFGEPSAGNLRDAPPSTRIIVAEDLRAVPPSPMQTKVFWLKAALGLTVMAGISVAWWILAFTPWAQAMELM